MAFTRPLGEPSYSASSTGIAWKSGMDRSTSSTACPWPITSVFWRLSGRPSSGAKHSTRWRFCRTASTQPPQVPSSRFHHLVLWSQCLDQWVNYDTKQQWSQQVSMLYPLSWWNNGWPVVKRGWRWVGRVDKWEHSAWVLPPGLLGASCLAWFLKSYNNIETNISMVTYHLSQLETVDVFCCFSAYQQCTVDIK